MFVTRSLATACLFGVAAVSGCGASSEAAPAAEQCEAVQGTPPEPPEPDTYDVASDDRAPCMCNFGPGSYSEESIGPDAPRPPPDAHVVVVMLENRSFDHYFSGLPDADTTTTMWNPDPLSPGHKAFQAHATDYCLSDTRHEWGAAHLQFDNGRMDGFVATNNPGPGTNDPSGARALLYYDEGDLPFAFWLATNFAVSKRHFSSLLGPTWPNRLFMLKGTSCGFTQGALDGSTAITEKCGRVGENLFTQLDSKNVSYELYDESGIASVTVGLEVIRYGIVPLATPKSIEDFEEAVARNELPAFSMVGASTGVIRDKLKIFGAAQDDDHPKSDVRNGQRFMYRIVNALMTHQQTFEKTILFITYDENGGFYDHVVPPPACEPDQLPGRCPSADERPLSERRDYYFDRYGFRVPFIVVSPYLKRSGYVSDHITDHASILRFVQHWQKLPALTRRDANAWPFLDFFDFERGRGLPMPQLPVEPPAPTSCTGRTP